LHVAGVESDLLVRQHQRDDGLVELGVVELVEREPCALDRVGDLLLLRVQPRAGDRGCRHTLGRVTLGEKVVDGGAWTVDSMHCLCLVSGGDSPRQSVPIDGLALYSQTTVLTAARSGVLRAAIAVTA